MSFKPAHKDTVNPPGQIVNPIDRSKTIGGIIDRVMRSEADPIKKKLTFDEWVHEYLKDMYGYDPTEDKNNYMMFGTTCRMLRVVWKAAQENV